MQELFELLITFFFFVVTSVSDNLVWFSLGVQLRWKEGGGIFFSCCSKSDNDNQQKKQ